MDKLEIGYWMCSSYIVYESGLMLYRHGQLDILRTTGIVTISFLSGYMVGQKLN